MLPALPALTDSLVHLRSSLQVSFIAVLHLTCWAPRRLFLACCHIIEFRVFQVQGQPNYHCSAPQKSCPELMGSLMCEREP